MMRKAILFVALVLTGPAVLAYRPAELLKPGVIHGVAISPSGRYIAVATGNDAGATEAIAILDVQRDANDRLVRRIPLATPKGPWIVGRLSWASDAYLLALMNPASSEPVQDPARTAVLHSIHAGGDGAIKPYDALPKPVRLFEEASPGARYIYLMSGPFLSGTIGPRPYEVELATGSARLLAEPDTLTMSWRVRDRRAVVKFNEGRMGAVANIFESKSEGGAWTLVSSLRFPEDRRNHLEVIAEGESPLQDYMRKTRDGADVDGILLRDLRSRQIVAKVFEQPGHDVLFAQFRQYKFVSATYLDDTLQTRFADDGLQRHYVELQKRFGADVSIRVTLSSTLSGAWILHVSGPRSPGEYHFYDPERQYVELIGAERPWLQAERLAPSTPLAVTARDGTPLRAYLTCPADASPAKRPLVVMTPEGPWAYAYLRFNAYVQAFAAQGWCVVQPNVRGTYGRGRAFQAMGFGQWNGRVAEDVLDTVLTLVKNGTADPDRVAGYGEYFGATALIAAEAKQSGLLKAIVAYAPVLDGENLLAQYKNLYGRDSIRYVDWSLWLGALGENDELRNQLFQVRTALHLVHPFSANEIPVGDSKALVKALGKAGLEPEAHYPGFEGKQWTSGQDDVRQLEAEVGFLRKHLGPGY